MPRVPYPDPLYPVVWADTPDAPDTSSAPTGGPWVNVRGTRYETIHPGENDWVASLGGRMSAADQSQADISLELNVDHSAFGAMMKVAKIPEMISGIYGNWKSQ